VPGEVLRKGIFFLIGGYMTVFFSRALEKKKLTKGKEEERLLKEERVCAKGKG